MKVIISGAGLIGLLTAQALKARGIEFVVFDRDESVDARAHSGWAITIHWAMNMFKDLIPAHLVERVYGAQVRKEFHTRDSGNFMYIDAGSGEAVVRIPPLARLRVRREEIRSILMDGIDVQWGCKMVDVRTDDEGVVAVCSDGREFSGSVLLGCEGSNSATRRAIFGGSSGTGSGSALPDSVLGPNLHQLPIRFCGARVEMSAEETESIAQNFDPLLFQGTVPGTNTFFWFSMLSTPEYDGKYTAQVNLSWNDDDPHEKFVTSHDMARAMEKRAAGLSPKLRWLVDRAVEAPDQILEIKLRDWPAVEWDHRQGKIILAGDSAHAMTMYRGEAANHGIADVADLMKQVDQFTKGEMSWVDAVQNYCDNVKTRAAPAVLLSRQACIDAHDFTKIYAGSESPLLAMRKK